MIFLKKYYVFRYAQNSITHNRQFVLFVLLFPVLLFQSCKKHETLPPVISLETSQGYVYKDSVMNTGTNFPVKLTAEMGDENITNIVIRNSHDGTVVNYFDTGINNEKIVISKVLTKGVYENETWTFIAIDKNGKNASVSFTTQKDPNSQFQDVKTYNGVILGAQNCSSNGSFMSLNSGNILFQADAFNQQDSIELLYYYDVAASDENTIASPGANIDASIYSGSTGPLYWTVRNETRVYKTTFTAGDFNNVQNDSLLLVAYTAPGFRKAKNLVVGDVYSFKTTHAKYGIFLVEQLDGTDQGTIQFSIKIQK